MTEDNEEAGPSDDHAPGATMSNQERSRDWTPIVLLFFSVVANIYLGLEWMVTARYPWGDTIYDKAGRKLSTFYYRPMSYHPYRAVGYRTDESVVDEWLDPDRNGRYDEVRVYVQGTLIEKWHDGDEDGAFDAKEILSGEQGTQTLLRDLDRDGYPEMLSCNGASGPVELNVLNCSLTPPSKRAAQPQ